MSVVEHMLVPFVLLVAVPLAAFAVMSLIALVYLFVLAIYGTLDEWAERRMW